MKLINKELLKKYDDYMKSLTKNDRIAVIHHTDPDGVSSGVIISKVVERLRGKKIDFRHNQGSSDIALSNETVKILKKKKINKLITTDMAVDQYPETLKAIAKFADILVLDHHKVYGEFDGKKIIVVKPHLLYADVDPTAYCAGKFCFDLGLRHAEIKDLDWIAVIAIIGDSAYNYWKSFCIKTLKKHKIKVEKEVFATKLGRITGMISDSEAYSYKKAGECYDLLYKAKNYKQILNSKIRWYSLKIRDDKMYWLRNYQKLAEFYDEFDLVFYHINPKYSVKISTILSYQNPHKTLIVLKPDKNMISISARRQDRKIKVNDLLEDAVKNLENGTAGGHVPAAGGKFMKKDLRQFKKNIIKLLSA